MAQSNLTGSYKTQREKITTQTYKVTHDGAGNSLPYMNRSFISFTFGGKAIEEFNLIVVNSGDRLERDIYAPFTDSTSEYEILDGQNYWGSRLQANKLELTLATDEMTEQQLDSFREWFAPGKERELILAEHPNRAILARVSSAPSFSVIPFEKKTTIKINKQDYTTSTTVYRGEITLNFVMDEPYWYAKLNYMPTYVDKKTLTPLSVNSTNNNKVISLEDKDMLKIMVEDGIPHQSVLDKQMFIGGNILVTSRAEVGSATVNTSLLGISVDQTTGLEIAKNNPAYIFYSGTAKSYPIIKFAVQPLIGQTDNAIYWPRNKIYSTAYSPSSVNYSYIKVGEEEFRYTLPSLLASYNQAIIFFNNITTTTPISEILTNIRDKVNERYARAWAIFCIKLAESKTEYITNNSCFNGNGKNFLKNIMKTFINPNQPVSFIINSKTGEARGTFSIKLAPSPSSTNYSTINLDNISYTNIEENVGDMIVSNYLVIEGRNYLNSEGLIQTNTCLKVSFDADLSSARITDFLILFQNMYL